MVQMAKTRSQTRLQARSETASRTKRTANLKVNFKRNIVMKDCRVRLDRIDLTKINSIYKIDLKGKSHNLRKRAKVVNVVTKPIKPLNQIVALSQAALYTSRAVRIWDTLKKQCTKNMVKIQQNDIVCARMSGHRPWPAKVVEFKRNGVQLHFFGTNESGTVKKSEIVPWNLCQEMIGQYMHVPTRDLCTKTLMYHMSFIKSIREVSGINV